MKKNIHTNSINAGVGAALHALVRAFTIAAVALAVAAAPGASGQAQFTSPPPGSTLAYPSFSLAWQNINAAEYFLYLGSQQGVNDYFGASMGNATSVELNWPGNRPAYCWVRVWSRINVYSGYANSSVAYSYWAFADAIYRLVPQGQSVSAKSALIGDFVNAAASVAGTVADYQRGIKKPSVGECKSFLQQKFNTAGFAYKLPNSLSPIMPINPAPNEGVGVNNWYWVSDPSAGFNRVGSAVTPGLTINAKRDAVMALLRQVQKGDTLQMVMKAKVSSTGYTTTDYVPHTVTFVENYVADNVPLNWVDSNMDGQGTPLVGTQWYWGQYKTLSSLADRIAAPYGAATLYRVREDITRR